MSERDWSEVEFKDDPELLPEEKQFSITATRRDGWATVHSEISSVSRKLVNHDDVVILEVREKEGVVHAVTVSLPINCLLITASGRQTATWCDIVSRGVEA